MSKHTRKQIVNVEKLKRLTTMGMNVMLIGEHGVGKTSLVKSAWDELGLKYKIFYGSTIDPWTDLIGIPMKITREKKDKKGVVVLDEHGNPVMENVIDFARPENIANDEIEAIFIDEFNRSPKKVRNAVMELIQFKSINGVKLKNLKVIWAAVNPDDSDDFQYDVEKADPAQVDRFQVLLSLPYEPNKDFFVSKYGGDVANQIIKWWKTQTTEVRKEVSPRRLEYAIDYYMADGDINDVITHEAATTSKLIEFIGNLPKIKELKSLFEAGDDAGAMKFLSQEANYDQVIGNIKEATNYDLMKFCFPNLPEEKMSLLIAEDTKCAAMALQGASRSKRIFSVLENIAKADQNISLCRRIKSKLKEIESGALDFEVIDFGTPSHVLSADLKDSKLAFSSKSDSYASEVLSLKNGSFKTAAERMEVYKKISTIIPKEMEKQEALDTISVINSIVSSTPKTTLAKSYPLIMDLINVSCKNASKHMNSLEMNDLEAVAEFIKENEGFIFNTSSAVTKSKAAAVSVDLVTSA